MMPDLLYIGVAIAFFGLTLGLMAGCDRLMDRGPGERK